MLFNVTSTRFKHDGQKERCNNCSCWHEIQKSSYYLCVHLGRHFLPLSKVKWNLSFFFISKCSRGRTCIFTGRGNRFTCSSRRIFKNHCYFGRRRRPQHQTGWLSICAYVYFIHTYVVCMMGNRGDREAPTELKSTASSLIMKQLLLGSFQVRIAVMALPWFSIYVMNKWNNISSSCSHFTLFLMSTCGSCKLLFSAQSSAKGQFTFENGLKFVTMMFTKDIIWFHLHCVMLESSWLHWTSIKSGKSRSIFLRRLKIRSATTAKGTFLRGFLHVLLE